MAEPFDPYHRWLGIPPKHQPADYYRLLGIERFEEDREVIRDAADRQMAHVRTYQLGECSALSQKILNELAAARVCLLNPEKKTAYDKKLQTELVPPDLPEAAIPPEVPPLNVPTAVPVAAFPLPAASREPVPIVVAHDPGSPRPHRSRTGVYAAVAVVSAACVVLVAMLLSPNEENGTPGTEKATMTDGTPPRTVATFDRADALVPVDESGKMTSTDHSPPEKAHTETESDQDPAKRVGLLTGNSKPVIGEITVTPEQVAAGGEIKITILAHSNVPISGSRFWFRGEGVPELQASGACREIKPGVWQSVITHKISEWQPPGRYTLKTIHLRNPVDSWMKPKGDVSFTVSNERPLSKPVIGEITVTPEQVAAGGEIKITILAHSNVPISGSRFWFRGEGVPELQASGACREIKPGVWQSVITHKISEWQPPGRYTLKTIHLRNPVDSWMKPKGDVSFTVTE